MSVPEHRSEETFDLICTTARSLGMLREVKGAEYVDLDATIVAIQGTEPDSVEDGAPSASEDREVQPVNAVPQPAVHVDNKRVFVSHGKNKAFVEPLKELLQFGDYEAVVSAERETVSKPVPDKVLDDMRSCSAAIIHVDRETELMDKDGERQIVLNHNVLIEIGAAMALYGRRFILLVRDGVKLPSNLQGLYEVRYDGEKLDAEGTIKVLKALKDIKNNPLPEFKR